MKHLYDVPKPRTSYPSGHLRRELPLPFPGIGIPGMRHHPADQLVVPDIRHRSGKRDEVRCAFIRTTRQQRLLGIRFLSGQSGNRLTAAKQVGKDSRSRPSALDHEAADELVVLPLPGQILLFSGAHLHASIPNTSGVSRYSVDFRIIDRRDVLSGRGAPMVDVECSGTMLREFASVVTDERLPESLVRQIAGAPPDDAILLFDKDLADASAKLSS